MAVQVRRVVTGHDTNGRAVVKIDANDLPVASLGNSDNVKVGQWVNLGGGLQPDRMLPVINPLFIKELGWHTMPTPLPPPVDFPIPGNRDGRWTELEGVAHAVNANGTLSVPGKDGPICLWLGQTPANHLSRYVDAKLRVRGVLSLSILEVPVLLIPLHERQVKKFSLVLCRINWIKTPTK